MDICSYVLVGNWSVGEQGEGKGSISLLLRFHQLRITETVRLKEGRVCKNCNDDRGPYAKQKWR